jgi:hypothetical protein
VSPIVVVLISTLGGIAGIVLGGLLVQSRTKAETKKLAAEAEKLAVETEDRIYARIKAELKVAVERADKADERAQLAEKRADRLSARVYELYDLIERHIPWDQEVAEQLRLNKIHVEDPPTLNPYPLNNQH